MNIEYTIEFFSNWHCGSGLTAGADVDALVVKDGRGLPYVPGRTIKGLLREAAETLGSFEPELLKHLDAIFGISGDDDKKKDDKPRIGEAFFKNATLVDGDTIVKGGLTAYLYQTFSSTAIDESTGIAAEHSLRRIETVVPCTLKGSILNVPEGGDALLKDAMKMVKRMGTGRNRGYGRCTISPINSRRTNHEKNEIQMYAAV